MTSKIKILPLDVLLLIIDYLDSPTMMDCRQVSRSWLDVVDGNRSLWNYFQVKNKDPIHLLSMLKLFAQRSGDTIKAFHLDQKPRESFLKSEELPDQVEAEAMGILEVLLRSKDSLKAWYSILFGWDSIYQSIFFVNLSEFKNLKAFSEDGILVLHPGIWTLTNEDKANHQRQSNKYLVSSRPFPNPSLNTLRRSLSLGMGPLLKDSALTLKHLKLDWRNFTQSNVIFPALELMELFRIKSSIPEERFYPNLISLVLTLDADKKKFTFPDHLPSSLKAIYLETPLDEPRGRAFTRGSFNIFKKFYPNLIRLELGSGIEFYPDELLKMLKARKAAEKKGVEVDGIEMKSIEKLTMDLTQFDETALAKFRELVPKVVNTRRG